MLPALTALEENWGMTRPTSEIPYQVPPPRSLLGRTPSPRPRDGDRHLCVALTLGIEARQVHEP